MSVAQAENLIAEINNPEVLKKHFMKQVKSFSTSLKKYKEKAEIIGVSNKEKRDIDKELKNISSLIK